MYNTYPMSLIPCPKTLCLLFLTTTFLSCSDVPDDLCNSSSSGVSPSSSSSVSSSSSGGVSPPLSSSQMQSSSSQMQSSSSETPSSSSHVHVWNSWTQTTAATCNTAGVETRVCINDPSHSETQPIPKITYDSNTEFCYSGSVVKRCAGNPQEFNPDEYECKSGKNGVYFKNIRDGESVLIGTQTWMTKNLNKNVSGSKCADDKPANCTKYGMLYNWATAMALSPTCNESECASQVQPQHQGICPSGWHIPSGDEWNELFDYVGGWETAGTHLRARSGWPDHEGVSRNGEDTYGFSALPGGSFFKNWDGDDFHWNGVDFVGFYWCSGGEWSSDMTCAAETEAGNNAFWTGGGKKLSMISVRCVLN